MVHVFQQYDHVTLSALGLQKPVTSHYQHHAGSRVNANRAKRKLKASRLCGLLGNRVSEYPAENRRRVGC